MPQINKPKGSDHGSKLSSIAPLLSMIPVVGPIVGAVAGVAGGQMSKKENSTPDPVAMQSQMAPQPAEVSTNPMQRRLDNGSMQQLQDSIQVASQMPPQIQQQAQPYLESAYQEAMKRRMAGGSYA